MSKHGRVYPLVHFDAGKIFPGSREAVTSSSSIMSLSSFRSPWMRVRSNVKLLDAITMMRLFTGRRRR